MTLLRNCILLVFTAILQLEAICWINFFLFSLSGAMHGDELEDIFRYKLFESLGIPPLKKGPEHYKLMERMIEIWVNFATFGRVVKFKLSCFIILL